MDTTVNSTNLPNLTEIFDTRRVDFTQFVIYTTVQFLLLATEIYILAAFSHYVKIKR